MNEPSYVIDTLGIEEEIRCTICKNQIKTDKGCDGNCKYDENLFRRITNLLNKRIGLLPIYPEPHWIPVTKDTPKEAGTYMCTCYDAGRRIVTLAKWQPRTKTWNLTGARAYWKVIAWCKCPEPYKGVTE